MRYKNLGRTGMRVSSLCLGCMNFGDKTDQAESVHIMHAAIDAGINFFDTANVYGPKKEKGISEQIVGEALADGKRDQVILATKVGGGMGAGPNQFRNTSRYAIMLNLEASLGRLKTDYLDLYQIHVMDRRTPLDEVMKTLDDIVRSGKARYVGVSKWAPALIAEAVMLADRYGWVRPISEQPPYNLLDRSIENELMWTCDRHGLGIIPWAPIAGGILSGKYNSDGTGPEGSRFSSMNMRLTPEALKRIEQLKPLADQKGVTLAEFALAWVMGQPFISSAITGPSKMEHLESSLKALDVEITQEDRDKIDEICPPGSAVSDYYSRNVYHYLRQTIGITPQYRIPPNQR